MSQAIDLLREAHIWVGDDALAGRIEAFLRSDATALLTQAVGGAERLAKATDVQRDVLRIVVQYRRDHGHSPTLQEIADERGTSKVSVFDAVRELTRKRLVRRDPNRSRSIVVRKR